MKKVLTVITIAGLGLALSAGVFAQGAGPKGGLQGQPGKQGKGDQKRPGIRMGMGGKRMAGVYKQLNLTPEQSKKMEALQKSTQEKMKALMEKNKNGDRKAMRDQIKPIMEAHQKGVKDILTAEQEAKLEQIMKEMRKKRMDQGSKPAGANKKAGTGGGTTTKGGGGL